jgi:GT2 family glycosyltransferase
MSECQVVIPVYGKFLIALETIKRVCEHTPSHVVINVIDDGSPNAEEFAKMLSNDQLMGRINYVKQASNLGFVKTMNAAFKACRNDDVIILNSDCYVSPGWFENMIRTSRTSDLVSTVTAMTNEGSIASVRLGSERLLDLSPSEIDQLNLEISRHKSDFVVQVPVGVGHCMWISRISLENVGYFDEAFSPGYGEEVDFCIRAVRRGFHHLICKETLVYHIGGNSFEDRKSELQQKHENILFSRYPNFHEVVNGIIDRSSEMEAAFLNVLLASRPLRLLLDCRLASPPLTGTSRYSIELAKAVVANTTCQTFLLVEPGSVKAFTELFDSSQIISADSVLDFVNSHNRFDVVVRLGQVGSISNLGGLWQLAYRVGIVQLDFIAPDNFLYFESARGHLEFVDASKHALSLCDSVLYLSRTIMKEAFRYAPNRIPGDNDYTDCGFNHIASGIPEIKDGNQVVVLGAAFAHKNREWIIKILAGIIKSGKPDLKVLLIGPTPSSGDTTFSDKSLVNELGISKNVEFIEWISDGQLEFVFQNCALSISCSISEGFGMVPLELAMKGVVPISYGGTSFSEHAGSLPYSLGLIDAELDAQTIRTLLNDQSSRRNQLQHAVEMTSRYLWEDSAQRLISSAFKAARLPSYIYPETRREFFRINNKNRKKWTSLLLIVRNTKIAMCVFPPGSRRTARVSKFILAYIKI